ncbi:MAG: Uma2 family endonuclease [Bacteroidota bacterium]
MDDYLLLGEMNTPCQLINSELTLSPSPTPYHQLVSGNLYDLLKIQAKKNDGIAFYAPVDLYIDNKNVFQPDLVYISSENKNIVTGRGIEGIPELVVEIISPSNVFTDRNVKKEVYRKIGLKEFWLVDPGNKTLEIYLPNQTNPDIPHLYLAEEGIVTSTILTELKFDLKDIFQ